MKSALHERTEAVLDGMAALDVSMMEPDALAIVLTSVGDALRLDISLPINASRKLTSSLSEAQVLATLEDLSSSVGRWSLPASASDDEPDHDLERALRDRDEIESVLLAARRILLPRGVLVDASPAAKNLLAAVLKRDLTCGGTLTRSRAEQLLGDRQALITGRSWVDAISWAEEPTLETVDDDHRGVHGLNSRPGLEELESYVVDGRLRKWVEREASLSAEVAEDIADMIATYNQHGGQVGIVARRWAKGRTRATYEPPVESEARAAADRVATDELLVNYSLGLLDPLDATASLGVTATDVLIKVFAGITPIREVCLGSSTAMPPASGGTWSLRVPRADLAGGGAILRVVDERGATFECPLSLERDS